MVTRTCAASYPTPSLASGNSTITVTYVEDTNYATSSASATLTVGEPDMRQVTTATRAAQNDGNYQVTMTVKDIGTAPRKTSR